MAPRSVPGRSHGLRESVGCAGAPPAGKVAGDAGRRPVGRHPPLVGVGHARVSNRSVASRAAGTTCPRIFCSGGTSVKAPHAPCARAGAPRPARRRRRACSHARLAPRPACARIERDAPAAAGCFNSMTARWHARAPAE
ncbi:regulatory protein, LuxR:Response regulator receiver [Burkholderia pseudomallei MSHR346]|nr:regulatory protein, LuxR:Response regulator receiver [Burkholderia pseudomallei MSHR346]